MERQSVLADTRIGSSSQVATFWLAGPNYHVNGVNASIVWWPFGSHFVWRSAELSICGPMNVWRLMVATTKYGHVRIIYKYAQTCAALVVVCIQLQVRQHGPRIFVWTVRMLFGIVLLCVRGFFSNGLYSNMSERVCAMSTCEHLCHHASIHITQSLSRLFCQSLCLAFKISLFLEPSQP